jgi:nudix motif 8
MKAILKLRALTTATQACLRLSTNGRSTTCCLNSTQGTIATRRFIFGTSFDEPVHGDNRAAQRIWKADEGHTTGTGNGTGTGTGDSTASTGPSTWTIPVDEQEDVSILIDRIGKQELEGGRMQQPYLGVLREDPAEDMRLLMENYTVPSLASAVRDREELLQLCAELANDKDWDAIQQILRPFQRNYVLQQRRVTKLNLANSLDTAGLEMLRKALMRMPRRVVQAHQRRAGVVLALCNVNDIPSLMLEKRSHKLRAHPDEVCLPGGMASSIEDTSIVATCLREMHEEIEGLREPTSVLGVLRCNWGEVHHLVGVAVTPVVCFVGEVADLNLRPNPDEVAEVFTIPLVALLRRSDWIHREGFAPIFVGGPHVIWGLTGYIIERFVKDILLRYTIHAP